jgi:hypothetical protein
MELILGSYHTTKRTGTVTTEDFIITLFCLLHNRIVNVEKRSDATLYDRIYLETHLTFDSHFSIYLWLLIAYLGLIPLPMTAY